MYRHACRTITLAAAGLMAATPGAAQAGGAPTPPATADSGHRMMDPIGRLLERREQLALTDQQARQLEAIRSKYQEKHQRHMEQMRRDHEARSGLRASMDSARAEVAAVLTPEQEKQVEAMRQEWRREWRKGHHRRHHDGPHGRPGGEEG
jgi:Spy/CpxP family protein refolding chaperone